jgi:chromosome segregation ATPase
LEAQKREGEAQRMALESRIGELAKEHADLQESSKNVQHQWETQHAAMAEELHLRQQAFDQEREALTSSLALKDEELKGLAQQVSDQERSFAEERQGLLHQLSDQEDRLRLAQQQAQEDRQTFERTQARWESQLNEEKEQLAQARRLEAELCDQRDQMKADWKSAQERLDEVLALLERKESQYQEEVENIEKRNAKIISDQENQIQRVHRELESMREDLEQKQARIDQLKKVESRAKQLELGNQTLKSRLDSAVSLLQKGLSELTGESEKLDFEE